MKHMYHAIGICLCLLLSTSLAQATQVTTTHEDTTSRAYQLGKLLRCPVCQGMPIAESPTTMARDMMQRIRQMVSDGKTDQQITSFFTSRYGDWVLLKPKAVGINLGVWLGPVFLVLLGLWFLLRRHKQGTAPAPPSPQSLSAASIHQELESD